MHNDTLSKRPLPKLTPTKKVKREETQRKTKNSTKLSFCEVCGGKASIVNYGVLSCQSCKKFFRRNGCHPERVHPCLHKRSCKVDTDTRRCCTACRLAKCFSKGMSSDFIRKEERKPTKHSLLSKSKSNASLVRNSIVSKSQIGISDQSDDDRGSLFQYEEKIISNVVHALERFSAIPKVRDIIGDTLTLFFYTPFDVENAISCISLIYTSMRSFINSTPDFQIMVLGEQCSLFERNFNAIVNLYSVVVLRDTGIINDSRYLTSFESIYGSEMMVELVRISKQLDLDLTINKLMLIILAFSSNCSMVDFHPRISYDNLLTGSYRLFGSQNVYVVVLWKYMVYEYGYYKAAIRFSQLIKLSLDLIKYSTDTYLNNTTYRDLVNNLNQNTNEVLVLNQYEHVRLWGRT